MMSNTVISQKLSQASTNENTGWMHKFKTLRLLEFDNFGNALPRAANFQTLLTGFKIISQNLKWIQ